jgi:NAD(P)-dependent dehydrogenase (short-subunit alcohol dehydrogenase family)
VGDGGFSANRRERANRPSRRACAIIAPSRAQRGPSPYSQPTFIAMPTTFDLTGKIAFVTGASSGLGARFARVLAANGAQVVLASRRTERLKELRAEIEAEGGAAHVVALDVTDVASIRAAVAHAETEAGPIDILVNNSGVSNTRKLVDVSEEDYDFVFDTNTRGAFFVAQEVARRMIARSRGAAGDARPRPARIINVASMAGLKVLSQIGVYCMSKAAVIQMTKAMALEWGRHDINVNAICPGYIVTELNEAHWETEGGRKLVQMLPRKRLGRPEDLDGLVLLLASEQSGFVNGAVIAADDGFAL